MSCTHHLGPTILLSLVDLVLQDFDTRLDLLDILVDGGYLLFMLLVLGLRLRLKEDKGDAYTHRAAVGNDNYGKPKSGCCGSSLNARFAPNIQCIL